MGLCGITHPPIYLWGQLGVSSGWLRRIRHPPMHLWGQLGVSSGWLWPINVWRQLGVSSGWGCGESSIRLYMYRDNLGLSVDSVCESGIRRCMYGDTSLRDPSYSCFDLGSHSYLIFIQLPSLRLRPADAERSPVLDRSMSPYFSQTLLSRIWRCKKL